MFHLSELNTLQDCCDLIRDRQQVLLEELLTFTHIGTTGMQMENWNWVLMSYHTQRAITTLWQQSLQGKTQSLVEAPQAEVNVTHTAGERCGDPAHALPSGRAQAENSRCKWHGFLARCTHTPGLRIRKGVQARELLAPEEREWPSAHLEKKLESTHEEKNGR